VLGLGNPTNARPAVLSHLGEVFEAVEVHGDISTLLSGSLFADRLSFVDVIDATNFEVVGAFVVGFSGHGDSEECKNKDDDFHDRYFIIS
jgi:hypothetical protein